MGSQARVRSAGYARPKISSVTGGNKGLGRKEKGRTGEEEDDVVDVDVEVVALVGAGVGVGVDRGVGVGL